MKKVFSLLTVGITAGIVSVFAYHQLVFNNLALAVEEHTEIPEVQLTSNTGFRNIAEAPDFVTAAKESIDAVVHVKNVSIGRQPRSILDLYFGGGQERKAIRGMGSGVIISPDGYIITNHHVVQGATEVEITLNNNKTYAAEIIGEAPENDISLLKIDGEDFSYLPFGDSNAVEVGEWVLAVGNPFNLTSTVTAGIVSAKARDLNSKQGVFQSFIQTDAAVNSGNSGGALVNTNGDLIGINTAITSQTGAFIGYSFAIPSNNAKKIVEDLIEFGHVRKAFLGVRGIDLNGQIAQELAIENSQGFYVSSVESNSGAEKAGLKEGDIILSIDDIKIRKFSDLTGYINTKNPGEKVSVNYLRNGKAQQAEVKLIKLALYRINEIGIEVTDATSDELKKFGAKNGVKINRVLSQRLNAEQLEGILITEINDQKVDSVKDVEQLIEEKTNAQALKITFKVDKNDEKTYIFR
ncbi:MAG: trypsin-like peptidase domain-containing protein [Flavobacteriaceae bacterium]|nr:trypsin-like peptidase domain-containing protein [Flavobacteriaceae bacterium]